MSYPNDIYVYLTDTVGSGLPFLTPGDLPNPGIKPVSLRSPALAGEFFTTSATQEALLNT